MPDDVKLLELAARLEACAEDAKRPEPISGYAGAVRVQPPAIISLANGLEAIAAALRARGQSPSKSLSMNTLWQPPIPTSTGLD